MRDSELRGLILEALYNQRRKDLVNLDQELGALPVSHSATESILRQLKLVKVTSSTLVTRNWTSRTSVIRHWMFRWTIRKRATTSPNRLLNG
jgi:hypothetical protein